MGLSSVFSTAITGLSAAETTIDVVGNNIANSSTIGFKASNAYFATQFLQTLSLGSAPTATSGGNNPRQIGLGTQVAAISPDFTQGTIEISSSASDLAIQGDGFFIVQGSGGEQLYTRNGSFEINSQNQLVTRTGELVLGFGIDSNFQIQETELVPLDIPLGSTAVAKATENVSLQGTLTPTGAIADTAGIIESAVLGNAAFEQPAAGATVSAAPAAPSVAGIASASANTGTTMAAGTYQYKVVFADGTVGSPIDTEGLVSTSFTATVAPGDNAIDLSNLPVDSTTPPYASLRIYRTEVGGAATDDYYLVGEVANGTTTFTDDVPDATLTGNQELEENLVNSTYSYYVTYYNASRESVPSPIIGPQPIIDGALRIEDLPLPTATDWTGMRIYRNTDGQDSTYYRIADIPDTTTPNMTYTDKAADADIIGNPTLDFDGPRIDENTLLTNVIQRSGSTYVPVFDQGTLRFHGQKGERDVPPSNEPNELQITATTRVSDLISFVEQTLGIQRSPGPDGNNPIPDDGPTGATPGGSVPTGTGQIRFVSNNGADNAVSIGLSSFQLVTSTGTQQVNLPFSTVQEGQGQSAVADFIVFDTLGIPLRVRLTASLESTSSTETVYRWYADSIDNDPAAGHGISVGTGLIRFDGEGNFISSTSNTVAVAREDVPSSSPLEFELDFTQLSGLAASSSSLAATRQDGFPPGKLTNFIIGEDGGIRGVFDNGTERDLGQVRLARFANPGGLDQRGGNTYAVGINSGLPVVGNPGEQGIGSLKAGAVELSNTDVGSSLIELILASTQYRGNTRVINAAQQLLDELLNLRR